jgi:arabinan endo-1,5-alpha-L-arabinosidase
MRIISIALFAVIFCLVACTNEVDTDLVSGEFYTKTETPDRDLVAVVAETKVPEPDLMEVTVETEAVDQDPSLLEVYTEMLPPMPKPHWHIHDPTQLVKLGDYWMIGVTGKAPTRLYPCSLETWYILPGESGWTPGQCLFAKDPAWVKEILPENDGAFWAPGFLTPRMMYYSVNGGDYGQCIGLARATGTPPNLRWTDIGKPVTCTFDPENSPHKAPNSIDPDAFFDDDGNPYLVYGGGRIYITPLDAETGLQIEDKWWEPDDPNYHFVADKPTEGDQWGNDWIEAPFIFKHGGFYYLFVNWYGCCKGVLSTYAIHVGRSKEPIGPYVDQAGADMRAGGGTLLIKGEGKYIGPGHGAVSELDDGRFLFSFHYYDDENRGQPWISVRELTWDDDGWPVLDSMEADLATISNVGTLDP